MLSLMLVQSRKVPQDSIVPHIDYEDTIQLHFKWEVIMPPVMDTDRNCTLSVSSGGPKGQQPATTTTLIRFRFGDVWLCTGQSNMAMTLRKTSHFEKVQAMNLSGKTLLVYYVAYTSST